MKLFKLACIFALFQFNSGHQLNDEPEFYQSSPPGFPPPGFPPFPSHIAGLLPHGHHHQPYDLPPHGHLLNEGSPGLGFPSRYCLDYPGLLPHGHHQRYVLPPSRHRLDVPSRHRLDVPSRHRLDVPSRHPWHGRIPTMDRPSGPPHWDVPSGHHWDVPSGYHMGLPFGHLDFPFQSKSYLAGMDDLLNHSEDHTEVGKFDEDHQWDVSSGYHMGLPFGHLGFPFQSKDHQWDVSSGYHMGLPFGHLGFPFQSRGYLAGMDDGHLGFPPQSRGYLAGMDDLLNPSEDHTEVVKFDEDHQ